MFKVQTLSEISSDVPHVVSFQFWKEQQDHEVYSITSRSLNHWKFPLLPKSSHLAIDEVLLPHHLRKESVKAVRPSLAIKLRLVLNCSHQSRLRIMPAYGKKKKTGLPAYAAFADSPLDVPKEKAPKGEMILNSPNTFITVY